MPPNKNAAFKGYHLPFIGYTYTKNSILNDCHSLINYINIDQIKNSYESKTDLASITITKTTESIHIDSNSVTMMGEFEAKISKLELEKQELLNKFNQVKSEDQIDLTTESELQSKIADLTSQLKEIGSLYDSTKQSEVEERNKNKHLERAVRALKIEKEQLNLQANELRDRVSTQAKDLLDAQQQRKLVVQEFTDLNEKFDELRSKNVKLQNESINREDEIMNIKKELDDYKYDSEKKDRIIEELRYKLQNLNDVVLNMENEKIDFMKQISNDTGLEKSSQDNNLTELNNQLSLDLNFVKSNLEICENEISQLKETNSNLLNEIHAMKERNSAQIKDNNLKFEEQIKETVQTKDKEINFLKNEIEQHLEENEKVLFFFV